MPDKSSRLHNWALYLGLALTTCSMLLLQQYLTRVFSILYNAGLAFLAISITFLGLGAAGVAAAMFPGFFRAERLQKMIPRLAVIYSVVLTLCVLLLLSVNESMGAAAGAGADELKQQVYRVAVASAILVPPMFLVGLVLSLLFKRHVKSVDRLYGADLLGGGLGCLLVLPLINYIGGDDGIFYIGALAAIGAAGLAWAHQCKLELIASLAVGGLLLLGPLNNTNRELVDIQTHRSPLPGVQRWVREDREIHREWNTLSRIGIFETTGEECLYVQIDSNCQTTIPSHGPEHAVMMEKSTTFEHLPYMLDHVDSYLEIGAGGGRGMMLARSKGVDKITGVEINPSIVKASNGAFPGFGIGPLIEGTKHRYINDEGRGFVRSSTEKYDALTITFIQTSIAAASAAFALSEANLFTTEAFIEYLEHLTDDGVFYVYRHGGNELLRLVSLARVSLAAIGIDDMRPHIYMAIDDDNRGLIMIKRKPFSESELTRLDNQALEFGLKILYTPSGLDADKQANPLFDELAAMRENGSLGMTEAVKLYYKRRGDQQYKSLEQTYLEAEDHDAFADNYLVDIKATSDDRPYYFFFGLSNWTDFPLYFNLSSLDVLGGIVVLLFWMLILFGGLVGGLIALPLFFGESVARKKGLGLPVIAYFSALGLGYIGVQLSFVQRFVLFLGHPVYAVSVVLLAFLLWTGLGSIFSRKVFSLSFMTTGRAFAILFLTLLVANWGLPVLFSSELIAWSVELKILLSLLAIGPIAFQMGFFFPRGIQYIEEVAPELVPWAWGANSASSVLGSILALIVAIHGGFALTTLIAGAIYLVLGIPAAALLARRTAAA
ncbi:MAG: spermidine synthase [Planctomycetota bacterium]|jgi:spermidine synthase